MGREEGREKGKVVVCMRVGEGEREGARMELGRLRMGRERDMKGKKG